MRFFIGLNLDVEVIGELVELPNVGDEKFAVHYAVIPAHGYDQENWPSHAVSHIETGCFVAYGETADEAIQNARAKMSGMEPDYIRERIKKARNYLASAGVFCHAHH